MLCLMVTNDSDSHRRFAGVLCRTLFFRPIQTPEKYNGEKIVSYDIYEKTLLITIDLNIICVGM